MAKEKPEENISVHPIDDSILDIIIKDPQETQDRNKKKVEEGDYAEDFKFPDIDEVVNYSRRQEDINRDAIDLFPDLTSGFNIMEAIIINGKPSYGINHFYPPNVHIKVLDKVANILEDKHELNKTLSTTLENALFLKGSEVYLTLPFTIIKSLVSKVTNISTESDFNAFISKPINKSIFGDVAQVSSERLGFSITDNLGAIAAGNNYVNNAVAEISNGSLSVESDNEDMSAIFKDITMSEMKSEMSFSVDERAVTEDGMNIVLDSNSVVPIKLTTDNLKPIGYLILLDQNGQIVNDNTENLMDLETNLIDQDGEMSDVKKAIEDFKKSKDGSVGHRGEPSVTLDDKSAYTSLVNTEVRTLLKESKLGNYITPPKMNEVINIMFNRALSAQQTRLLYVPSEYITYYAFNFRKNGTGKSLLEIVRHLIGIRSKLLFAKIKADIENSISSRTIRVKLDPTNKKPEKSMANFIRDFSEHNNKMFRWNNTSIQSSANYVQNVGIKYQFEHPRLPYDEVETSSEQIGTGTSIDMEFIEKVRGDIFRRFGLTKQMVDDSTDQQFATISVLANDLSRNELSRYQIKLMDLYTEHCRRVLRHDGEFQKFIVKIVNDNYNVIVDSYGDDIKAKLKEMNDEERVKRILKNELIKNITATLPTLRNEDESTLQVKFAAYKDNLDEVVDNMIISPDSLPSDVVGEDLANMIDTFKTSYTQLLLRQWMVEHDYMTEVADIVSVKDGTINIDHMKDYMGNVNSLITALEAYSKDLKFTLKRGKKVGGKVSKIIDGDVSTPKEEDVIPEDTPPKEEDSKPKDDKSEDTPPKEEDGKTKGLDDSSKDDKPEDSTGKATNLEDFFKDK